MQKLGTREELFGVDLPDQAPQVFSVGVFAVILIVVILFFPRGLLPALGDAAAGWGTAREVRPARPSRADVTGADPACPGGACPAGQIRAGKPARVRARPAASASDRRPART